MLTPEEAEQAERAYQTLRQIEMKCVRLLDDYDEMIARHVEARNNMEDMILMVHEFNENHPDEELECPFDGEVMRDMNEALLLLRRARKLTGEVTQSVKEKREAMAAVLEEENE